MSDELWSLIEPLLPEPAPKQVEGRPRVPDRQALCGILFVLHTGIQWEYLPQELGFGSGMTFWRRLAAWNEAGVWDQLHQLLLNNAAEEPAGLVAGGDRLLARQSSSAMPKSGPSPVDRARPGSKHHVITDRQGIPLAVLPSSSGNGSPRRPAG
ncbi:IS5 family transposase [Streptomyces sp. IBSBF 3352]|uniref:IS5 family transposase n=1 Tax=Streptomyces sp. IBSBF 3352 TaxID=2903523 RepID=UPI002FDC01B5